jgi:predicted metal-dependent HD superfamily phosphohydrolase
MNTTTSPEWLESIWNQLITNIVPNVNPTHYDLHVEIGDMYSMENRHYHSIAHINDMINKLIDVCEIYSIPESKLNLLIAAALFHDCVQSSDDIPELCVEAQSAVVAKETLIAIGVTDMNFVNGVVDLIKTTETHTPIESEFVSHDLQQIFCDCDLSILGASKQKYMQYAEQIRFEYANISDIKYATARGNFLKTLLEKNRIFNTNYMNEMYEATARINIQLEIDDIDTISTLKYTG